MWNQNKPTQSESFRNQLFAIYDEKAAAYGPIITHSTVLVAIRSFELACKNRESMLATNPEDYSLYCIAGYDERGGVIVPHKTPQFVIKASEVFANLTNKIDSPKPEVVL